MRAIWLACCVSAVCLSWDTSLPAADHDAQRQVAAMPSAGAGVQANDAAAQQPPATTSAAPNTARRRTNSPSVLHQLLGIDPLTDQFLPPQPRRRNRQPSIQQQPAPSPADDAANVASAGTANNPDFNLGLGAQPVAVDAVSDLLGQLPADDPLVQIASVLPQLGPVQATAPADWRVAGAVSVSLLLVAVLLMLSFWMGWRNRKQDETLDAFDLRYYGRRFRRRTLTAAIFAVLAVLIPMGSYFLEWWDAPGLSVVYWSVVFGLSTWASVLLAVDYYTAKSYVQAALANMRRNQRELLGQINELKAKLTGEQRAWSPTSEIGSPQSSFAGE